ncbi:MAG: DUF3667 domain-containing protein [Ekhidna sp.]
MRKEVTVTNEPCLNCHDIINGSYCKSCGQKAIDNVDRSITTLIGDFLGNLFFLDNRFYISLKNLLLKPGVMTVEFLSGKRRKYISPISLFLFVNLIYFFLNPLTDYSLPLYDQINHQPYSSITKKWVKEKIEHEGIEYNSYRLKYNKNSDDISKIIMILNVPFIAFFVYLFSFWKRQFYFDSFIFSVHFFSFFLSSVIIGDLIDTYLGFLPILNIEKAWFIIFLLGFPLIYLIVQYKRFTDNKWWLSILVSPFIFLGLAISQGIYRFIIFLFTFLSM